MAARDDLQVRDDLRPEDLWPELFFVVAFCDVFPPGA